MVTEDRENEGMEEDKKDDPTDSTDAAAIDELFLSPDDSENEEIVFGEDGVIEMDPVETEPATVAAAAPPADPGLLDDMREQLSALTEERDDYKNRMLRTAADLENFRRRTSREKEDLRKFGIDKVVLELLPVLDNLDRALDHAEKASDQNSIIDGVRMVQRQFMAALEKHGVKGFDSRGEAFDPQRHEAIQQVETTEHETGTVLEEYQRGYFLHERLIRPALVVVARRADGAAARTDEGTGTGPDDSAPQDAGARDSGADDGEASDGSDGSEESQVS